MSKVGRRVSSPTFVGRGEQLQAQHAAFSRAAAGQACAVFIAGDAGVGKSRLVMEFERLVLERDGWFLLGGCVDVGGSELPYAPLLAALRALTRELDSAALEELVGARAEELGRRLPELATAGMNSEAIDPLGQSRLFEALLALFTKLGESAPVTLLENLLRQRVAEPLASARATATRLGAQPLLQEIEIVSRRARIRTAQDQGVAVPDEVAGLTERELDVLRLIAAGRTNPEIGNALYMSPKTASVHVRASWPS